MSIIVENNKKHFLYIIFLTLFFVSGKWIISNYFYSDEELLNKIIFEVKDKVIMSMYEKEDEKKYLVA